MRGVMAKTGRALALLALVALGAVARPASAEVPKPKLPPAKGEKCVEPTEVMRRKHMDYLLHQRDDTLRRGIRGGKYSLRECLECHVTAQAGQPLPTYGSPDHFCSACHRYAAVQIDCFGCHRDRPEQPAAGQARAPASGDGLTGPALPVRTLKVLGPAEVKP